VIPSLCLPTPATHCLCFALGVFIMVGCGSSGSSPNPAASVADIVDQSKAGNASNTPGVPGVWRTKALVKVPGASAWVDLIWMMGDATGWHVVTAYADEDLTIPLVRWDVIRDYSLGSPLEDPAEAIALDWSDRVSWVTAYVDSPELFGAMGLDDCKLSAGETVDTRLNNCGAPFFPFRDCIMMDFALLDDDVLTFGDPRAVDRCETRVTDLEAWSFERVALDASLDAALQPYPQLQ
jgi:hypothetical protein